jgi:hypothetical protein
MDYAVNAIVCIKGIGTDRRPSDVVGYDTTLGYVQNLTWWGCHENQAIFGSC